MLSTIDTEWGFDKGMILVPKEYPNWYGIEDIGYIYKGTWADPYVEYNGYQVNALFVEQSLWDDYQDYAPGIPFEEYVRENADYVRELLEMEIAS